MLGGALNELLLHVAGAIPKDTIVLSVTVNDALNVQFALEPETVDTAVL